MSKWMDKKDLGVQNTEDLGLQKEQESLGEEG